VAGAGNQRREICAWGRCEVSREKEETWMRVRPSIHKVESGTYAPEIVAIEDLSEPQISQEAIIAYIRKLKRREKETKSAPCGEGQPLPELAPFSARRRASSPDSLSNWRVPGWPGFLLSIAARHGFVWD
jgi:hypothetical protein